jgi:hypothetical protein
MTELSKVSKALLELRAYLDDTAAPYELAICISNRDRLVNDLQPRGQKLLAKAQTIDPVTKEARYGQQHRTKIDTLVSDMNELTARYETILSEGQMNEMVIDTTKDSNGDEKLQDSTSIQPDAVIFDLNSTFQQTNRLQEERRTLMQEKDAALSSDLDPLKDEKVSLHTLLKSLNAVNETITPMAVPDRKQLFIDKFAVLETNDPLAKAVVFTFVSSIINNIVSHPEDENLRLLRLTHPTVFEEVVQFPHALEVFVAMGFSIIHKAPTSKSMEWSESILKYLGEAENQDKVECRLLALCHTLTYEPYLCMKEPSVDSGDTTQWITWFDSLSAIRDVCNA